MIGVVTQKKFQDNASTISTGIDMGILKTMKKMKASHVATMWGDKVSYFLVFNGGSATGWTANRAI